MPRARAREFFNGLLGAAALALATAAHAATNYVTTTGAGSQTGADWANATTLTNALAIAGPGDELWLAEGTYTNGAPYDLSLGDLALYGGFDGTETQLVDRALTGESVISGQGILGCIDISAGNVLLDNMVISNGFRGNGGGIYALGHSSLTMVDCRIDDCAFEGSGSGRGGGAFISGGTSTLVRCSFVNNTGGPNSWYGRGFGMYALNSIIEMADCVFSNNTYSGGTNPSRGMRGGGFHLDGGTMTASNCTFEGNNVTMQSVPGGDPPGGGAGYFRGGAVATFTDCTFTNNSADRRAAGTTFGGGTFRIYGAAVSLYRCTITDSVSQEQGGAVFMNSGSLSLQNCIVAHNSLANGSRQGGGFYIAGGSVSATNCTIAYNSSLDEGGAFYLSGGSLALENCILATNTAPIRGADISNIGGTSVDLNDNNLSGDPNLTAYVFGTVTKANNQWLDPRFADATYFHLKSQEGRWDPTLLGGAGDWTNDLVTSLCIDAGDPAGDYSLEPSPHGGRLNLGGHGNTPRASKTFAVVPIVTNRSYSVTNSQVTMRGELIENDAIATIRFYYGFSDWNWEGYSELDVLQQTGTVFEATVAGLEYNSNYVFRCFATNSVGYGWASNLLAFTTGGEPPGGGPGIIHVKADATGDQSGRNWFDACPSLDAGVARVQGSTNTIWMAAGADTVLARIATNVSIYGGFAGTETQFVDRALTGESIMNGQGFSGCIEISAGDVLLDNMVISNGFRLDGGGVYASGHNSLTMVDCRIDGCAFTRVGSPYPKGGGAYIAGGTATLTRCSFVNNTGSSLNAYGGRGFGLYALNAIVQMADCVFSNNVYSGGTNPNRGILGGAFHVDGGTMTASNCTFAGNKVTMQQIPAEPIPGGGAGYFRGGTIASFTDCMFSNNRADRRDVGTTRGGGAFLVNNATVSMHRCTIIDSVSQEQGGAVYMNSGSLSLQNCVVAHSSLANGSRQGGGFYIAGGTVAATNCTFAYNSGLDEGGAVYLAGGDLTLKNSIIASNSAPTRGADISNVGGASVDIDYCAFSEDHALETNVYDGAATLTKTDLLVADPLFASANDFHLQSRAGRWDSEQAKFVKEDSVYSPCIDAGDPASSYANEPMPAGKRVNLGAYGNTAQASISQLGGTVLVVK